MKKKILPSYANTKTTKKKITKTKKKFVNVRNNEPRKIPSTGKFSSLKILLKKGSILFLGICSIFFLVFILTKAYHGITNISFFALNNVHITGNTRLANTDILKYGNINLGQNTLSIPIAKTQQKLLDAPWIENVSITRKLPNELFIDITERKAYFWVQQDKKIYYADRKGEIIAALSPEKATFHPLLEIDSTNPKYIILLEEFLQYMESSYTPIQIADATWIKITPSGRLEIFYENTNKHISLSLLEWKKHIQNIINAWLDLVRYNELEEILTIRAINNRVWVEKKD